jgi:hypothetical protein
MQGDLSNRFSRMVTGAAAHLTVLGGSFLD